MPENRHLRRGLILLYAALGVLCFWLLLNYALKWLLPFIIAFGISRLIEPGVRFFTARLRLKRGLASGICTLAAFSVIIMLLIIIVGRIIYELTALAKDIPSLLSDMNELFSALRDKLNIYIMTAPAEMQDYFQRAADGFAEKSTELIAAVSGWALGILSSAAANGPKVVIFIFTCAISTFFISSGYKEVTAFLLRQLPRRHHNTVRDFKADLVTVLGKWAKAEVMLAGVTFVEVLAAFFIMRVEFAILLALLVAFVDLLPVFGAGSVLIPWAVISLAEGDYARAAALAVTFGIIVIVRNILEPKLIGGQIGLPPIVTLIAMYVGLCAVGIFGMILFPIGIIMLKHLNDRGHLKLWK